MPSDNQMKIHILELRQDSAIISQTSPLYSGVKYCSYQSNGPIEALNYRYVSS